MSTAQDQGYRHILKYTGIFGGVQGLQLVLGLLRTKLMAILLAPSGMGLASLFQSTSQFLSQATNLGVSMSAVRQLSTRRCWNPRYRRSGVGVCSRLC